jgi:hypothetical protein
VKLTIAQLKAISAALNAALAGEGFDGGDFIGMEPEDFESALVAIEAELEVARRRALRRRR